MADRKIYTFSEIVNTIITKIGNTSRSITDFSVGSNNLSFVEAFSHFIEFIQLQINIAQDSFSILKAKGANLDNRVQDYGITRKNATPAAGVVKFSRTTPSPQTFIISAGVQVSTLPDVYGNTVDYALDTDITFPAGSTSVTGNVTCIVAGIVGNQPSGSIVNITSNIPGITSVTNESAVGGGSDRENDDQLRKRVADKVNGLKAGNEAAIRSAALSVDGVSFARISSNDPRQGEFTVYVSNQSGVLTANQVSSVTNAVKDAAAFGITANVHVPSVTYVTITMDVSYDTINYDAQAIDTALRNAVYTFVSLTTDSTLQLYDIILSVKDIPGIKNVKNVQINGSATDFSAPSFSAIRLTDTQTPITINYV